MAYRSGWFPVDHALMDVLQQINTGDRCHAMAVYVVLKKHTDDNDTCFPGLARIGTLTGLSRNTVKKAIRCLEEIGVVVVERNRKAPQGDISTHLYTLPPLAEWPDAATAGVGHVVTHPDHTATYQSRSVTNQSVIQSPTGRSYSDPKQHCIEQNLLNNTTTTTATATTLGRSVAVAAAAVVVEEKSSINPAWEALAEEFSRSEVQEAIDYIAKRRAEGKPIRYAIRFARKRIIARRASGEVIL